MLRKSTYFRDITYPSHLKECKKRHVSVKKITFVTKKPNQILLLKTKANKDVCQKKDKASARRNDNKEYSGLYYSNI